MQTRSRINDERKPVTGSYWNKNALPQTVNATILAGKRGTCNDTIGHFELRGLRKKQRFYLPNALLIVATDVGVPTVTGKKFDHLGVKIRELTAYPLEGGIFAPVTSTIPFGTITNVIASNYANTVLAKTNPSAPNISVPAFIGELKDVPELIKDWGGSILRKIAKGHLSWRWGIAPMINDIRTMCDFSRLVDKRVKLLTQLRDKGVLRSQCSLGQSSFTDPTVALTVSSDSIFIRARRTTTYTSKVWGSVERKLSPGTVLPKTDADMRVIASQIVLGITSYELLAAAWELLPWSWFVDWFADVGAVIAANNNTIPMTWQNLCLMRTTTSKSSYELETSAPSENWARISGSLYQNETRKERKVSVVPSLPVLPTLQPLVEGKTWAILGSIAVLNRRQQFRRRG